MTAAVTSRGTDGGQTATLNRSLADVLEQRGWGVGYATPERGRHCQAECYGERPGPVDRTRSSVLRGRPLPPRWPWGIPSKDSLVIGEASYPCSLPRRAPSSATDLAKDSSSASKSAPPVVLPAAKAPARARRVATVSHTVSTTASTGRSIRSAAALRASRDPSEPSKQKSTGPSWLPSVMTFAPFSLQDLGRYPSRRSKRLLPIPGSLIRDQKAL